jgi:hypothetical protein
VLLLLAACEESNVPEDALKYTVTVTGAATDCTEDTTGYQETFEYAVAFEGSSATLYIGQEAFARGTLAGCDLTYETVVVGERRGSGDLKWQLFGDASIDPSGQDKCAPGEGEWQGSETFEVVESDDASLEAGCIYEMTTLGYAN